MDNLTYKLTSGKPVKAFYFLQEYAKGLVPDALYRHRLPQLLKEAEETADDDFRQRLDYYCQPQPHFQIPADDHARRVRNHFEYQGTLGAYPKGAFCSAYYFDLRDVARYFPASARISYTPGDVYFTPPVPSLVKSRLLTPDNQRSVLLKLDTLRHFFTVRDSLKFTDKADRAIFRGKIRDSRCRVPFLKQCFGHEAIDCGVIGTPEEGIPQEWYVPKKTISEHLRYKFILTLEGNDVASNLKWVLSSNSLALMPRPTCETWFMEGRLQAGVHYVEVRPDFTDIEEQMHYFIQHPREAEHILENAHRYVAQFFHPHRELLLSLSVMSRYLELSGQM